MASSTERTAGAVERDTPREGTESLWWLASAPAIWLLHFGASYATVAVWCGRVVEEDGPLGPVRGAVAVYTAVALAGIGAIGWDAHRRFRAQDGVLVTRLQPQHSDTAVGRHRFLGFATLLLAWLSAVAVVYVAVVAAFVGTCR